MPLRRKEWVPKFRRLLAHHLLAPEEAGIDVIRFDSQVQNVKVEEDLLGSISTIVRKVYKLDLT